MTQLLHRNKDMDTLPQDPNILLSYINTKLRDLYPSLEDLCDDLHIEKEWLLKRLADAGFEYSDTNNKFW